MRLRPLSICTAELRKLPCLVSCELFIIKVFAIHENMGLAEL
jgi:hypothetical protein